MNTWNGKQLPEGFTVCGPSEIEHGIYRYGLLDEHGLDWVAFHDKLPSETEWIYNPQIEVDPMDKWIITALAIFQEPPND